MTEETKTAALIEQYKVFIQEKEAFVTRNFSTNKFFMVAIFALLMVMVYTRDIDLYYGIKLIHFITLLGMGLSFLWWSNLDAYQMLIKVKLKDVIEKIEEQLPFQTHKFEKECIDKYRKEQNAFLFGDVQKGLALMMFIIFFVFFLITYIPSLLKAFGVSLI